MTPYPAVLWCSVQHSPHILLVSIRCAQGATRFTKTQQFYDKLKKGVNSHLIVECKRVTDTEVHSEPLRGV